MKQNKKVRNGGPLVRGFEVKGHNLMKIKNHLFFIFLKFPILCGNHIKKIKRAKRDF